MSNDVLNEKLKSINEEILSTGINLSVMKTLVKILDSSCSKEIDLTDKDNSNILFLMAKILETTTKQYDVIEDVLENSMY